MTTIRATGAAMNAVRAAARAYGPVALTVDTTEGATCVPRDELPDSYHSGAAGSVAGVPAHLSERLLAEGPVDVIVIDVAERRATTTQVERLVALVRAPRRSAVRAA